MCGFQGTQNPIRFPVTMAKGIHLFPYRTQKLSLSAPMVLGWRRPGRVGRCRIPQRKASDECLGLFLCVSGEILLSDHLRRSQRTYLVRIFPAARSAGCRQEKSPGRVGGRTRKKRFSFRLQGNRSIIPRYRKVVVPSTHTAENHDFISSDQGSKSSTSKSLFRSARSGNMLSKRSR